MKKLVYIFIIFAIMLLTSCVSQQVKTDNNAGLKPSSEENMKKAGTEEAVKPAEPAQPAASENPAPKSPSDEDVIAEFNGVAITRKDKKLAKSEIEEVVKKLNTVTSQKDYSRWLLYLSSAYKTEYSRADVLKRTSESLPGIAKGIVLKDLSDYFSYVFVPSRQQMRVDDIKYLSPSKVQVIQGKLILYNLGKINGKWLLVP